VSGDVHAFFSHNLDSERVKPMFRYSGGKKIGYTSMEISAPPFCHLAAAGIAGTKK
jgi:hypothetical protein